MELSVEDRIKALRLQILIHSIIYYEMDDNIISDYEWSKRAKELVQLQKDNPTIAGQVVLHEAFEDFDGSTGFNLLAYADDAARGKAKYLLSIKTNKRKAKGE